MLSKVTGRLGENILLILAALWVLLWIFPWAAWLHNLPWVQLGIGGLLFATPGLLLSLILLGKRLGLLSHAMSGLALSVFFVGSLGLLGRVFHLPFAYIKPVFVLAGLLAFFVLFRRSRSDPQLYKPKSFSLTILVLFLAVAALSAITSLGNPFGGDDFSYLAYLTNWQHAQSLNFHEVIFGSGSLDSIRFWFAMFPMNLAFLAEISNLPGLLLLGYYLEPFLAVLSLIAFYNLFEDLLPSGYLPIGALLLHFAFLFMLYGERQPGVLFFYRISQDKVFAAFILAPVFFLAVRCLLENVTPRTILFTLLIGLSLALTHPVILAYSIVVAGLYACFVTVIQRDFKRLAIVVLLLVVTILPSASLRFVGVPWVSKYVFGMGSSLNQPGAFDLESATDTRDIKSLISYVEHTRFYGFNLERVQIQFPGQNQENPVQAFLSWSYLWILGLGFLWSLFNLRKNQAAPLVGATSLLVLLCAIPYTGWLLGYLVSARMLWRAPWMFSAGLAAVILADELIRFLIRKGRVRLPDSFSAGQLTLGLVFLLSLVIISSLSLNLYAAQWNRWITTFEHRKSRFESLARLGNYLEGNIPTASIFAAPGEADLSYYLPVISSKSKVALFRSGAFAAQDLKSQKIDLIFSQDKSIALNQRMNILKKYHIQYVLIDKEDVKDFYARNFPFFGVQKAGDFWILKVPG